MSDVKALAAALLAELAPALKEIAIAEIRAHVPSALQPVAVAIVDAGADFAEKNPGVGNPPPKHDEVPAAPAETIPAEPLDNAALTRLVMALSAKLDALVQATGHGNSAAMSAHL